MQKQLCANDCNSSICVQDTSSFRKRHWRTLLISRTIVGSPLASTNAWLKHKEHLKRILQFYLTFKTF